MGELIYLYTRKFSSHAIKSLNELDNFTDKQIEHLKFMGEIDLYERKREQLESYLLGPHLTPKEKEILSQD